MTDRSFQFERVAVVLQDHERGWTYFDYPNQITLYCAFDVEVPVGEITLLHVSPVSFTDASETRSDPGGSDSVLPPRPSPPAGPIPNDLARGLAHVDGRLPGRPGPDVLRRSRHLLPPSPPPHRSRNAPLPALHPSSTTRGCLGLRRLEARARQNRIASSGSSSAAAKGGRSE